MAANNTIQRRAQETAAARTSEGPTMQQYIKQMQGEIKKALPAVMTPERFSRIVLSALSTNPKLAETTPQSFLGAMMTAAQLGVEPNTPWGRPTSFPSGTVRPAPSNASSSLGIKASSTWPTAPGKSPPSWPRWSMRMTSSSIPSAWSRSWYTGPLWRTGATRSMSTPCSAPRMGATDTRSCPLLMSGPMPRDTASPSKMARGRPTSRRWRKRPCSNGC